MCGIWAVFGLEGNLNKHCGCSFPKITHRGPDAWRLECDKRIKVSIILYQSNMFYFQYLYKCFQNVNIGNYNIETTLKSW